MYTHGLKAGIFYAVTFRNSKVNEGGYTDSMVIT
jgi:hypothetical protein